MGSTRHHPLLAGFSKSGKPWVNPAVKQELGATVTQRIMKHQREFIRQIKKGKSWSQARKSALRAEHRGLTKKQIPKYEGKLGALERKLLRG